LTNLWRQSLESHILSHEIAASAVLAIVVARPIISPLDSSPHERREHAGQGSAKAPDGRATAVLSAGISRIDGESYKKVGRGASSRVNEQRQIGTC
jgi:hypothetical protein